ncbi:response regulator [Desertibacillus haloalkaliphilus]|uniref:response regulator n=1 Tax=Desertibacillus haloalkaliphilus TaxID=1328930 RepID=UPI001C2523D3|nr:response regulator [Desertibacillus haloalkaliphilus]MBU8906424.1 response regulator [Desertibacillus haloalkaliphilus]
MIHVLIVEDDPMVAEFNKLYLEQIEGFTFVSSVTTAKEALRLIEQKRIDLILLDIYMPSMNGLELLTEIRKLNKAIDVVIISAANDKGSIERALRNGAVDYLIKPFEFERFQQALTRYRNDKLKMAKHERFNQADLDHLIKQEGQPPSTEQRTLPKGLTKHTLKAIWETILEMKDRPFTTEELGHHVGISRVSIRKYLAFLNEIGVVDEENVYGSVGRPLNQYNYNPSKSKLITYYL